MGKEILETKKFSGYTSVFELRYVRDVIASYDYDVNGVDFDFWSMLAAIYHYGQVVGIRSERAKRRRAKA